MKMERVECKTLTPEVIATGVKGGGYVVLTSASGSDGVPIGLSLDHFPKDPYKETPVYTVSNFSYLKNKFWLNEGEKLYGRATYYAYNNSTNPCIYAFLYLNEEPIHQQEASPINLTGTIQLNQQ